MKEVLEHILWKIASTEIDPDPYPHFVVSEIFPPEFYSKPLAVIPTPEQFVASAYPGRWVRKGEAPMVRPGVPQPPVHSVPG